jgi:FixJ family two-component response regulator
MNTQRTTAMALPTNGRPVARPLIAVVDDDASFLRSVGRLLGTAGYAVEMFGSALEFLASLPAVSPQCLVVDVHMPGMTGLELQERLARQDSCLPIIFVTAYDTPQTREHAHRAGSFGLLLKPFDQQALLQAIGEAVKSQSGEAAPGEDRRKDRGRGEEEK